MDARRTGWSLAVSYMAADGSIRQGVASAPGRKAALDAYKRFSERAETLAVEVRINGRLHLRSVKDCDGKMRSEVGERKPAFDLGADPEPVEPVTPSSVARQRLAEAREKANAKLRERLQR